MINSIYSISLLLFAFGVLLVAVLALAKRRDKIALRFLAFSIAVCGWGFVEAVWFLEDCPPDLALKLMRISNASAIWIPMAWFHFVIEFINKKEPIKYFFAFNYLLAALLTLFSQTPFFISGTHSILSFSSYTSPGPLFHLFTLNFFILVPLGFFYLIKAYALNDHRREQFKFIILATIFGFVAGSSTFLPVYYFAIPPYILPLMVFYPFFMGIALTKYGLFDVQQIADAFQREKIMTLGIMAASLNHEMRNPLYIAKGKIEVYKATDQEMDSRLTSCGNDKLRATEVIDSVSHQLDRTLDIIQRFSDFAKPASMSKKEKIIWVDFFKDVTDLVSHAFYKKNIELKTDFQEGISLQIHRRQFEEILVNLLINASQALGEQGGVIEVRANQTKEKFMIEVSDNGPGISEAARRQIFEPFITTKEKGTGLGLYITKQLIERNNGCISVRSERHQGTMFVLEFKT